MLTLGTGWKRNVCYRVFSCQNGRSAPVMSFGRRRAYESPRGRNPRATVNGYGYFDLWLMSAMARPPNADRLLRCSIARYWRPGAGPATRLSRPGSLLKKPVMLCRCRTTLNASATNGACPLPHRAPSRAAGSFHGPRYDVQRLLECPAMTTLGNASAVRGNIATEGPIAGQIVNR